MNPAERLPHDPVAARARLLATEAVAAGTTNRVAVVQAPWDSLPRDVLLEIARRYPTRHSYPHIRARAVQVGRRSDGSAWGAPYQAVASTWAPAPIRGYRTLVVVPSVTHAKSWVHAGRGSVARSMNSVAPVVVALPSEVAAATQGGHVFARAIFHDLTAGTLRRDPTTAVRAVFFWDLVPAVPVSTARALSAPFPFHAAFVAPSVWDPPPRHRAPLGPPTRVEDCPICLETRDEGVRLRCGHAVCRPCMQAWESAEGERAVSCPLCRADVTPRAPDPPPEPVAHFGGPGGIRRGSAQIFRRRPGARALVLREPPTPIERAFLVAGMDPDAQVIEAHGPERQPTGPALKSILWH